MSTLYVITSQPSVIILRKRVPTRHGPLHAGHPQTFKCGTHGEGFRGLPFRFEPSPTVRLHAEKSDINQKNRSR